MTDYHYARKRRQASYCKEATWAAATGMAEAGVAGLVPGVNIKWNTVPKMTKIPRHAATHNDLNSQGWYDGLEVLTGSFSLEMIHSAFIYFALGGCTTVDNSPSGYNTHNFSESLLLTYPSFVLERALRHTGNIVHNYIGCKVKQLSIEVTKNEAIKNTVEIIGKKTLPNQTLETLSDNTTVPYRWYMHRVYFDLANSGAYTSGTELKGIQSANYQIINSIPDSARCDSDSGGNYIAEPLITGRDYKAQIVHQLRNNDFMDALIDSTLFGMRMLIVRDADNDFVELTWENCTIEEKPQSDDPDSEEVVEETLNINMEKLQAADDPRTNNRAVDSFTDDYYET